jgi:hypothetical protein
MERLMEPLKESLDVLGWPTHAVNALRAALSDVNVPLPAWLAQGVVLIGFALVTFYFFRWARGEERKLVRVGQLLVGAAGSLGAIAILISWGDAFVNPPSRQLLGAIEGAPLSTARIDLVDYKGSTLAATVEKDLQSRDFVIDYSPEFADPPSALVVSAPSCDEQRVVLRRPQLQGEAKLSIVLKCQGGGQ